MMVRSHMAQTLKLAVSFVEHGHVRVGTELVTDPALLVARYRRLIRLFYEQLVSTNSELSDRLVPPQCLGIWRRGSPGRTRRPSESMSLSTTRR